MGSFLDLRGNPVTMLETEGKTLSSFSTAQLEVLNINSAFIQLEHDMRITYGLETNDPLLNDYVDKYTADFQRSLQYLMLYYFYYDFNDGYESKNYDRKKENWQRYQDLKAMWPRNLIDNNQTSSTGVLLIG